MPPLSPALEARVCEDARKLCRALGYEMNTVEFAIRDGVPYAIDFMNSAPDFDVTSLGEEHFRWVGGEDGGPGDRARARARAGAPALGRASCWEARDLLQDPSRARSTSGGKGRGRPCAIPDDVRDPYDILGVDRSATQDELKAAFRRLASQHHPDKNPGDDGAHHRFKEINAAYQILSDPQKRAAFDRYGEAAMGGPPASRATPSRRRALRHGRPQHRRLLRRPPGRARHQGGRPRRPAEGDRVTFEEAAFGCAKEIKYERVEACETCARLGVGARILRRGVLGLRRAGARALPAGGAPHRHRAAVLALPRHRARRASTLARAAAAPASWATAAAPSR